MNSGLIGVIVVVLVLVLAVWFAWWREKEKQMEQGQQLSQAQPQAPSTIIDQEHEPEPSQARAQTDEAGLAQPEDCPAPDWSPKRLSDIVGQAQAVQRLKPLVELSRGRGEPLPHILLIGAEGMGKRTLAAVLANEMEANMVTTAGPSLERGADLMGVLTNLAERDVLFIDEINGLPRATEELLYPAMEDFSVDFVMDKGLNARNIRIPLRPFTLVVAAQKVAEVSARLRSLFLVTVVLQPYSESELSAIALAFARTKGLSLTPGAAALIGRFSGGSLRKVRSALQFAVRPGAEEVTETDAAAVLAILGYQVTEGASSVPADLMQLSGTEFELCVTGLLQRMGFRTELTRATGDGGIDIEAYLDRPIVGGRYLVQCKRFIEATPVGAPMVRDFYGAFKADRIAVKGLFITTSCFSAQAREFVQKQNLPIELVDGAQLKALLAKHITGSG
jgi:Holliday junction DNA helicase RuvB